MDVTVEKRGNRVCLFAKLESTDGTNTTVLTGQGIQFTVAAVGTAKAVAGTRCVEPILILGVEDARRLARQILSDTKEA